MTASMDIAEIELRAGEAGVVEYWVRRSGSPEPSRAGSSPITADAPIADVVRAAARAFRREIAGGAAVTLGSWAWAGRGSS